MNLAASVTVDNIAVYVLLHNRRIPAAAVVSAFASASRSVFLYTSSVGRRRTKLVVQHAGRGG